MRRFVESARLGCSVQLTTRNWLTASKSKRSRGLTRDWEIDFVSSLVGRRSTKDVQKAWISSFTKRKHSHRFPEMPVPDFVAGVESSEATDNATAEKPAPNCTEVESEPPPGTQLWQGLITGDAEKGEISRKWKIIGVDECGVGALAGPLIVAAAHVPFDIPAILSPGGSSVDIDDSKRFSPDELMEVRREIARYEASGEIIVETITYTGKQLRMMGGVGDVIRVGHFEVVKMVEDRLIRKLFPQIADLKREDYALQYLRETELLPYLLVLVDGERMPDQLLEAFLPLQLQAFVRQQSFSTSYEMRPRITSVHRLLCNAQPIPKADSNSFCVAVASIVAKVEQLKAMQKAHAKYPHYGFDVHHGYATPKHVARMKKYGPCPFHRDQRCDS